MPEESRVVLRVPVELTATVDMAGLAEGLTTPVDDPKLKPGLAAMELADLPCSCFEVETEGFCKNAVDSALSILDFKTLALVIPDPVFV